MEEHKDFPNFWNAVLLLALLVGLQIIISMLAYDLGYRYEWGDPVTGIITVISCGILFSLLMGYKKIGYKDLFNATSNSTKSLILVLFIPIAITVGGGVFWVADITNLMMVYFPVDEGEYMALTRMVSGGLVSVVSVCLIAPVIEEMLFRGIILRSFLVNYSANSAILLSSILFALFHLTVVQLPVAFIMGCLLGWLYVRTRSIWPSIVAHFLYNSFAMLLWSTYYPLESKGDFAPVFNSTGVIMAALASSIVGVMLLYYILNPNHESRP